MPPRKHLQRPHKAHYNRYTTTSSGRIRKTRIPLLLSQGTNDTSAESAIANATPEPEHAECLENDTVTASTSATVTASTSATEPAVMAPGHDHVNTYYTRKSKEVGKWTAVRDKLLHGYTELQVPEEGTVTCCTCQQNTKHIVRCLDCGPALQWCESCAYADHQLRPYHTMEQWMVSIAWTKITIGNKLNNTN